MLLLLLALFATFAAWWWFHQSKKPFHHRDVRREKFAWLLKGLAETMKKESVLVIQHQCSDRFIQFVKSESPSGPSLGMAFPDAPWSREYFESLREALSEDGFFVAVTETGDHRVPRFLEVEFQGPLAGQIGHALRAAALACHAMHLDEDETFTAHFRGELDSDSVIEQSLRTIREARRHGVKRNPRPGIHT